MKIRLSILAYFILVNLIFAQQHKFVDDPKVSIEDLKKTKSTIKEDAPAEVLYRSIQYVVDVDYDMEISVVDRVKIYNKDKASNYLDHEIALFESKSGKEEKLYNMKATTYNLENGKIVATKVEKDSKYKSVEDKRYNIVKFAFPNVKDGSVVEYTYKIMSPFIYEMPRIVIEEDIPIKYTEYVFDAPKQLGYSMNYQGSIVPKYRVVEEKTLYGADYRTYRFGYDDLKPFKEEDYVKNNNNYKTSIRAELNSTYIGNQFKSYSLSWQDVRKQLYEDDDFGLQLKKDNLVKDLLPAEIKQMGNDLQRSEAILKFVQKKYTWNGKKNVATEEGIKNLITTGVGNSAEINLLLVMLLKSANINANPVVLSTVDRGVLTSFLPSITSLNYVIVAIEQANKIYLLDATSKLSYINVIPPRAVNYSGILVNEKEAKEITIVNPEKSYTHLEVEAKLEKDGTFTGNFKDRDTKLYAMLNHEEYVENKEKYQKENYKERYKFPYNNIKTELLQNNDLQTSFDFSSDSFVDSVGNKLVFNPLLFLYSQNHGFNQTEERRNPIEFLSAYEKNKKVTITLPDGYIFENIPKSKKFKTDDDAIQYTYIPTLEGNKLTLETQVIVDDTYFPKEYYPAFKQIFDAITQLEGQVVTAIKK